MAGNDVPPAGYAPNAKPEVEAKGDASTIRTVLERDGATAAADRLRQEVDAVPEAQRDAYNKALLTQLQGDGNNKNVLPELAIAFGLQHKDQVTDHTMMWNLGREGIVSPDKINKAIAGETNPVYQELYRQFGDKYKQIKADNAAGTGERPQSWDPFEVKVPESQLQERLAASDARHVQQTDNRNKFAELATNPKLFDGIAGADGAITKDKVQAFQDQWNQSGDAGKAFRAKYATSPDQERRVAQTVEDLKAAYDDPHHKGNVDGSVLKDNRMTTLGIEAGSSYGTMTKDSLLKGMGYANMDEAKRRLPQDVTSPTAAASLKPNPDVNSVTDYKSTAQGYHDGPSQVAANMLKGDATQDQRKFFTNPDEAQRMLTDVLKQPDIWKFDKQGQPHVTGENRDQVLAAIQAAEAKKATDSSKPANNELSNWFASRYPKLDSPAAPAAPDVEKAADFGATKVQKGLGADAVTRKILEGSGLDDNARRQLMGVINNKDVTGVDFRSAKQGTEVLSPTNLEKVRDAIAALPNNAALKAWFDKRYPQRH